MLDGAKGRSYVFPYRRWKSKTLLDVRPVWDCSLKIEYGMEDHETTLFIMFGLAGEAVPL